MKFQKSIQNKDKFLILKNTGFKFIRGLWKRIFLKKATGIFLVGKKVQITHGNHISCGRNVKFEDFSEIHGLCSQGLSFGDNVTISRGVMIRSSSYYGGDLGEGLVIGDNSSIGPYGYVGCAGKIEIGESVMIGPKVTMIAENHVFKNSELRIKEQGVIQKGIVIENDCWIGAGVIILDGVRIGTGSVIGAGTLLTKNVPENSIIFDKKNKSLRNRLDKK